MRRSTRHIVAACVAAAGLAGCATEPFKPAPAPTPSTPATAGRGPTLPEVPVPAPGSAGEPVIEAPLPTPVPRERPKTAPATLSPASKALVTQAQTQRRKGDLPGATVSLERALRIEPRNPLLWIEMGRLRMDQRNYPQAEAMGRKALSMSVGDGRTQSAAWQLIADSLRARGKNPEAQEALEKAQELAQN
jgi:Tfp pilus assembly protein PilF